MGSSGSMSFIGTVGVVAQQGNQAVTTYPDPPTSIATSSSGDYNYAMLVEPTRAVYPNAVVDSDRSLDGSEFSRTGETTATAAVNWDASDFNTWVNNQAGAIQIYCGGYMRTSRSTVSPVWSGQNMLSSLSNGCSIAFSTNGTWKTVQDCTTMPSSGLNEQGFTSGEQITFSFGGGRGGITTPAAGDTMEWEIKVINDTSDTYILKVEVDWV